MAKGCLLCGTWECARCGWKRIRANSNPKVKQDCHECGSTDGTFTPTRHTSERTAEDHNEAYLFMKENGHYG